jgi:hypothetical protein
MRPSRRALRLTLTSIPIALLSSVTFCPAWTPSMDERIVREAVRLMPASLRGILQTHADEMKAGLKDAAGDEAGPFHTMEEGRPGASAAARVQTLASQIVALIDGRQPFAQVARRMGEMAHYVGDLNNPLHVCSEDPREPGYALDYAEYVESNLDRYPLVFYGWGDPSLDLPGVPGSLGRDADLMAFGAAAARRARRYYPAIRRAYAPGNREPVALRFDVRSLPFGVASLSYSHSVTDTARVWLHVWNKAHGDLQGTPYLGQERAAAASSPTAGVN